MSLKFDIFFGEDFLESNFSDFSPGLTQVVALAQVGRAVLL